MAEAFLCDAIRTPFGRYGGALASSARTISPPCRCARSWPQSEARPRAHRRCALRLRQPGRRGQPQRGAHGRAAGWLTRERAGGATINRLCGSSLDAAATVARAIRSGDIELVIAGGVESMTRAPFVMGKADSAYSRAAKIEDTTIGWRFVNPRIKQRYGVDSMPETAENLVADHGIARADQDAFALRSQQRCAAAQGRGFFAREIVPVTIAASEGRAAGRVSSDEHPRGDVTLERWQSSRASSSPMAPSRPATLPASTTGRRRS